MDWIKRLFLGKSGVAATRGRHTWDLVSAQPHPEKAPRAAGRGFAVVDVETTGLSPSSDRVLELAIVRTDMWGRVVDEWFTRFNPQGPVGATHIHGITAHDVARAPVFGHLVPHISARLAGAAVVAHNAPFDLAFLRAEYQRAGWALPWLPALCTLDASWHYLPRLDRRRLVDCCWAAGVRLDGAHSALGDARAVAHLLAHYLDPHVGRSPKDEHLAIVHEAAAVSWPQAPQSTPMPPGAVLQTRRTSGAASGYRTAAATPKPVIGPLLSALDVLSLADVLDEGAPAGSGSYLELLAQVLEDGQIDSGEAAAMREMAEAYGMDDAMVASAHRAFLLALAHVAMNDGRVSQAERAELLRVCELLGVDAGVIKRVCDQAETARQLRLSEGLRPLPSTWTLGEPLRVGDKVVFTGCDDTIRTRLERRAEERGVRIMSGVNGRTAMLVTDGSFDGTKAAAARELGTRIVSPDDFTKLLQYLQPARSVSEAQPAPVDRGTGPAPSATDTQVTEVAVSPAIVRAWARTQGHPVGVRGRLPVEVMDAYARAHDAGSAEMAR